MGRLKRVLVQSRDDDHRRASGLGCLNAGRSIFEHEAVFDFLSQSAQASKRGWPLFGMQKSTTMVVPPESAALVPLS